MQDFAPTGLCPICRGDIAALSASSLPSEASRQCGRCETWYHQDCWEYAGGCGIFGCEPGTRPRACPPAALPLPERLIQGGRGVATGMLLFLLGAIGGFVVWCVAGLLALPLVILLNFCADKRSESRRARLVRRGLVFGPAVMAAMPFPMLFLAVVPLGAAIVALGHGLRFGLANRALTAVAAAATFVLLFWSHTMPGARLHFWTLRHVPDWVARDRRHLVTPEVFSAENRRILILPRGAVEPEVLLVSGRLQVRCGKTLGEQVFDLLFTCPWITYSQPSPTALSLPPGNETIEIRTRGILASLLGHRLDLMLTGGSEAVTWAREASPIPAESTDEIPRNP